MSNSKNEDTDILLCDCFSAEHQIIVNYDKENKLVYFSVHLITYQNIFKRIWVAVKYVFGYTSKYGHWDSVILNEQDKDKIQKIVDVLEVVDVLNEKN